MDDRTFDLASHPVHLGIDPTAEAQPAFTGEASWYEDYARRTEADGSTGRLVSLHSFEGSWDTWEVHPEGEELVVCLSGSMVLHQERDGSVDTVTLEPYRAVVNPVGVWHTADIDGTATALFVTPGRGTEVRPR